MNNFQTKNMFTKNGVFGGLQNINSLVLIITYSGPEQIERRNSSRCVLSIFVIFIKLPL